MQYNVTDTTIVANTGGVRGYPEERKEERAILKERRTRVKPWRPGSRGVAPRVQIVQEIWV